MKNSFKRIYDPQNDTKNDTKIQRCEKTGCWLKTQRMRGEKMKENSAVSMKSALERAGKGFTTQGDRIKHEKLPVFFLPEGYGKFRVRMNVRVTEPDRSGSETRGLLFFRRGSRVRSFAAWKFPGNFRKSGIFPGKSDFRQGTVPAGGNDFGLGIHTFFLMRSHMDLLSALLRD